MTDTVRSVRLYGELGARFGREFKLAVSTPAEAVRALSVQIPGFEQHLMTSRDRGVGYAVFIDKRNIAEDELLFNHDPSTAIRIAPILMGSKNGGILNIIVGAVLVVVGAVVGIAAGWTGVGAAIGGALVGLGISMMVGGIMQLLTPMPKANKGAERPEDTPSYSFSGTVNTQAQGHPVPLLYGHLRVGSAVISAGISSKDGAYVPNAPTSGGSGNGGSYGGGNRGNDMNFPEVVQ